MRVLPGIQAADNYLIQTAMVLEDLQITAIHCELHQLLAVSNGIGVL